MLNLAQRLAQLLAIDDDRLGIQGNIQGARKLSLAGVAPAVVGTSLHGNITPLHQSLLAAFHLQLQLALNDHSEVHGHSAMPHGLTARVVVDVAHDGTAGDHEGRVIDEVVLVLVQVGIVAEGSGKGPEGVGEEEIDANVGALPFDWLGDFGLEGGGSVFLVGRDEAVNLGEVFLRKGAHFEG